MSSKNIYSLPIKKKDFSFAISDKRAHYGCLKHAVDFPLKEGTKILAAADGVVIDVVDNFDEGGDDPKYADNLNYITLEHPHEEVSQCSHLKYKGSLVKIGDKVKKGDVIGFSGNTGYSTEPHLHFMVTIGPDADWKTIKPTFDEEFKIERYG